MENFTLARSYAACAAELLRAMAADAPAYSVRAVDAQAAADEISATLAAYAHLWTPDG